MRRGGGPARAASSSVAIGVATVFIALAALLSCFDERSDVARWPLRGTLAPEGRGGEPARLPAVPKHV